jgi:hypothetical protein
LPRPMAGAGGLVLVEMDARFPWNTATIGDFLFQKLIAGVGVTPT